MSRGAPRLRKAGHRGFHSTGGGQVSGRFLAGCWVVHCPFLDGFPRRFPHSRLVWLLGCISAQPQLRATPFSRLLHTLFALLAAHHAGHNTTTKRSPSFHTCTVHRHTRSIAGHPAGDVAVSQAWSCISTQWHTHTHTVAHLAHLAAAGEPGSARSLFQSRVGPAGRQPSFANPGPTRSSEPLDLGLALGLRDLDCCSRLVIPARPIPCRWVCGVRSVRLEGAPPRPWHAGRFPDRHRTHTQPTRALTASTAHTPGLTAVPDGNTSSPTTGEEAKKKQWDSSRGGEGLREPNL